MSNLSTIPVDCPDCGVHLDVPLVVGDPEVVDGVAYVDVSPDSAYLAEHTSTCHA